MRNRYKPGDHYLTCDRTGFKIRASDARLEWTGAIVRKQSWEARHPQDFVKARRDNPAVDPKFHRPQSLTHFIGPLTCVITADALPGTYTLTVDTSARFAGGDTCAVMLANKDTWIGFVVAVPNENHLEFLLPFPEAIAAGGAVINYTAVSPPNLG